MARCIFSSLWSIIILSALTVIEIVISSDDFVCLWYFYCSPYLILTMLNDFLNYGLYVYLKLFPWASFSKVAVRLSNEIESWNRTTKKNHLGWKWPLKSWNPTIHLTPPVPPLTHIPKSSICMSLVYFQGWELHCFPGQSSPWLCLTTHSLHE